MNEKLQMLYSEFRSLSWVVQLMLPAVLLLAGYWLVFGSRGEERDTRLGVLRGEFCLPESKLSLILKSFQIQPLFLAPGTKRSGQDPEVSPSEGQQRMRLDSDYDGVSDKVETENGSDPLNRYSHHPGVSDLVWPLLPEKTRSRVLTGQFECSQSDSDGDLLTDCEEVALESDIFESINEEQTRYMLEMYSLNINHPDTDEDGWLDSLELRYLGAKAPFVYSNDEVLVGESRRVMEQWIYDSDQQGVEISLKPEAGSPGCFTYEVENFLNWWSELQDYKEERLDGS